MASSKPRNDFSAFKLRQVHVFVFLQDLVGETSWNSDFSAMERNYPVDEALQFDEFVRGFINEGAEFEFALVVEEVDGVHFAIAFSTAVAAVVSDFEVFFAATLASACF